MNVAELFGQLNQLPLFEGVGLGITLALLLSATFVVERWPVKLLLLLAVHGALGIVVAAAFPAYYGVLVWLAGFFAAGLLAIAYDQTATASAPSAAPTPLHLIALISAPLLIIALTGLLALWPAVQITPTFDQTWVIFLLLGLSLWQILRLDRPLPRTVGFLGLIAGLGLWQAVALQAAVAVLLWAMMALVATVLGTLFQPVEAADLSVD